MKLIPLKKATFWCQSTITDESGQEPIEVMMHWAWTPKKR